MHRVNSWSELLVSSVGMLKERAHCVLEEEHVPVLSWQVVQAETPKTDKLVAKVFVPEGSSISKRPSTAVENHHREAGIHENHQKDVLGVLGAHGTNRKLHTHFFVAIDSSVTPNHAGTIQVPTL